MTGVHPAHGEGPERGSREERFWLAVFALVLVDSLLVYFLKTVTGKVVPVNFLVAVLVLVGWFAFGPSRCVPRGSAIVGLIFCVAGFGLGIVFLDEFTAYRTIELAGGLLAFTVGFAAIRNLRAAGGLAGILLTVGGVYVFVCVAALWRLMPAVLPVIDSVGLDGGELIVRPEVTIDQNFQIYYLFLVALPLALPFHPVRGVVMLVLTAGAALVLARLQTRSGILIMGALVVASWAALAWRPTQRRRYLWIVPCIAVLAATTQLERIERLAAPLIKRFTGGDFTTLHGRVDSASYFLAHLLDARYWLPRGNQEYLAQSGDVPHFNPAAFLLEGGLIALAGWLLLHFIPLLRLALRFVRRRADSVATLALLGGTVSFVASLSLNAPHFKQAWLWAGAVVGALAREVAANPQPRWLTQELESPSLGSPNLMR